MANGRPIIGLTLNYRDAVRTLRCVRSLLNEGLTHVCIWDNSADEGTSVASLEDHLRHEPRVTIERSPINLGFAAGVNEGMRVLLERFTRPLVLIINNDAYMLPGSLAPLIDAINRQHQALIACPHIDNAGRSLGIVHYQRHTGLITQLSLPGSFAYVSGCCLLVDPTRIERPLFDTDFFMYGEDAELGARIGLQQIAHVAQSHVFHEGTASSGLGSPHYETHMVAAHLILATKLARSTVDLWVLLFGRAFTLPTRALVRSLRYRSTVPLRALYHGWQIANGTKRRQK